MSEEVEDAPRELLLKILISTGSQLVTGAILGIAQSTVSAQMRKLKITTSNYDRFKHHAKLPPPAKKLLEEQCKTMTINAIAVDHNVSWGVADNWVLDYGLESKSVRKGKLSKHESIKLKLAVVKALDETPTISEACSVLGKSQWVVCRLIEKFHIDKTKYKVKKRGVRFKRPAKRIIAEQCKRLTTTEIATANGVSWSTSARWIEQFGLKSQSREIVELSDLDEFNINELHYKDDGRVNSARWVGAKYEVGAARIFKVWKKFKDMENGNLKRREVS